jgi:hypothetical protein
MKTYLLCLAAYMTGHAIAHRLEDVSEGRDDFKNEASEFIASHLMDKLKFDGYLNTDEVDALWTSWSEAAQDMGDTTFDALLTELDIDPRTVPGHEAVVTITRPMLINAMTMCVKPVA